MFEDKEDDLSIKELERRTIIHIGDVTLTL